MLRVIRAEHRIVCQLDFNIERVEFGYLMRLKGGHFGPAASFQRRTLYSADQPCKGTAGEVIPKLKGKVSSQPENRERCPGSWA
jgi:hypothetical protein